VGFDPVFQLMVNRTESQLAFQGFERGFDLGQLHVSVPQHGRILGHQIGSQQVVPVSQLGLPQLVLVQGEGETLARYRFAFFGEAEGHETVGPACLLLGGPIRNSNRSRGGQLD
jgi:hypothetical protein